MADPPTRFFKFIPPGFKFDLSLPTSFLKQRNYGRLSKATLRRALHEWSVEIDDGVFGDGWRRFVRENGVQEFDFIVFTHRGGMVFDFLVFDQSTCEREYPNILNEMDVEAPPNDHPYFISSPKPYSLKMSIMHLPSRFTKQNGIKPGEMILMDYKDRSWKVQVNKKDERSFQLGSGLKAFLVAKGLKVGDAFKFELVEKEKNKPPVVKFSCLTPVEEDGSRYFMVELKSYNIQRSNLYLPQGFVHTNGLINKKEIILKNAEDNKLWKIELTIYKSSYYIGRGWKQFQVAHGLKEGDCLKLEVVDKGEKPMVNFYLQKN